MFIITLPNTFKLGQTTDCKINFAPARVTWRDGRHLGSLFIEPNEDYPNGEDHAIMEIYPVGDNNDRFVCGNAIGDPDTPDGEFTIIRA